MSIPQLDSILSIASAADFGRAALELFEFQSCHCAPYREYIDLLGLDPRAVTRPEEIPFLPIEVFRSRDVYCGAQEPEKIFTSSTTGGDKPSRHLVASLADYEETFRRAFSIFYGDPAKWSFYCLLPGYLEREGSSLVYMADGLVNDGGGGFFLRNHDELIQKMSADPKRKILLGVTYALMDLALEQAPKLENTIVMETGGMKGRRKELPKRELHRMLCDAFGLDTIHSEYGMAELSSQAYSRGEGVFSTPPWMKVWIRDVNDPFDMLPAGRAGGINIIDLANRYSCAFIQTQDLGRVHEDGSFAILGRVEQSQLRGCNLMVD